MALSIVASASRITGVAWTAATRTVRKVGIGRPYAPFVAIATGNARVPEDFVASGVLQSPSPYRGARI